MYPAAVAGDRTGDEPEPAPGLLRRSGLASYSDRYRGMSPVPFVAARHFTPAPVGINAAHGRPVALVVLHAMQSQERVDTAENVAAWFAGPAAPQASAHYLVDRDSIVKAVRHRWWGLFTCYRVSNVPSSNNALETFFNGLKHHQRRITGRKSVHDFILRYGPFAAFIDYAESMDDLLSRLRQVNSQDFRQARQTLFKVQLRLKKVHRFRHHPDAYYRDLENRWANAMLSDR